MSSFTLESLIVAGFLKAEWTICEQVPLKPGNQQCFSQLTLSLRYSDYWDQVTQKPDNSYINHIQG